MVATLGLSSSVSPGAALNANGDTATANAKVRAIRAHATIASLLSAPTHDYYYGGLCLPHSVDVCWLASLQRYMHWTESKRFLEDEIVAAEVATTSYRTLVLGQ